MICGHEKDAKFLALLWQMQVAGEAEDDEIVIDHRKRAKRKKAWEKTSDDEAFEHARGRVRRLTTYSSLR